MNNYNKMKNKFILFISLGLLFQSCADNTKVEVGNKTTMTVNLVYDAGNIVKGEVIEAKFVLKNTGKYPLVIGDAKGSCSCTVAEKPENPIAPGEEGEIKAHVTTMNANAGNINKSINIVANTEPSLTQVIVKANILNK